MKHCVISEHINIKRTAWVKNTTTNAWIETLLQGINKSHVYLNFFVLRHVRQNRIFDNHRGPGITAWTCSFSWKSKTLAFIKTCFVYDQNNNRKMTHDYFNDRRDHSGWCSRQDMISFKPLCPRLKPIFKLSFHLSLSPQPITQA